MPNTPLAKPIVRHLGKQLYETTWQEMRAFTDQRSDITADEIWILEHPPVFTLGQAGKPEHLLAPGDIPIVETDRGGQVTYHGPGQLVIYLLINIKRTKLGIRQLVTLIEQSIIELLEGYNISAQARADAPGVYVGAEKIAALGLRVRRGCSYHGLSLNIDMDLEPFSRINPCGYPDLEITQIASYTRADSVENTGRALSDIFCRRLATLSPGLAKAKK